MAQVTAAIRQEFGFMPGMVPANVLKSINDEELLDRLYQARSLVQKSQAAASPAERKRLGEQAQAVLHARPRAEVERLVQGKITKAAVTADPGQAADLRQQARQLLVQEQPAVRRPGSRPSAVAKAAATANARPADAVPVIILYDAAGNPAYAIDPDSPDLIPLTSLEDAGVTKVAAAKAAQPAGRVLAATRLPRGRAR